MVHSLQTKALSLADFNLIERHEGLDFLLVKRVLSQVQQVRTDPDVTEPFAAGTPLLHRVSFPEGGTLTLG